MLALAYLYDSQMTCEICLETKSGYAFVYSMNCSHSYCSACFARNHSLVCPFCREAIQECASVVRDYDDDDGYRFVSWQFCDPVETLYHSALVCCTCGIRQSATEFLYSTSCEHVNCKNCIHDAMLCATSNSNEQRCPKCSVPIGLWRYLSYRDGRYSICVWPLWL